MYILKCPSRIYVQGEKYLRSLTDTDKIEMQ